MRLAVWGIGHLAEATHANCNRHFPMYSPWDCEVLWFCTDTPVHDDRPDVDAVMTEMGRALDGSPAAELVLVSSQLPVGTCRWMEQTWPGHRFAVQPENIRIAHAIDDFAHQERMIVGTRHREDHEAIGSLLGHFTERVIFMSPESAEMTKHALNAFLALNIVFANEIADTCERVDADVDDVIAGFRSDPRVGNGPLLPGRGFEGGTLGRDVHVLDELCAGPVIEAIKPSNDAHL
jgi:UDPglucose 6-dehydrogenase